MTTTGIEWTDCTCNPGLYGCSEVSPACAHCYAAKMAHRQIAMGNYPQGITVKRRSGVHWTGVVKVDFDAIEPAFAKLPKRLKRLADGTYRHHRCFLTSMSDLFHEDVPDAFITEVFRQMEARPHIHFQVLTKRPQRMAAWWAAQPGRAKWPSNVWAGCTVEDQQRANERVPWLLKVPAPVRFVSCEPLVGEIRLDRILVTSGNRTSVVNALNGSHGTGGGSWTGSRIDWVITGGESGVGSHIRPSNPMWFQSLRDQCLEHGVAFFFKQWGEWLPADQPLPAKRGMAYKDLVHEGKVVRMARAGRAHDPKTLDGVVHQAFPEAA